MSKVLLISPPYMKLSYPTYKIPIALTKGCKYMNPGLLICSSIFDDANIENKIIKVNDIREEEILPWLGPDTVLVGISCTCSWEYLESIKIAEIIKKYNSNIKIVMSGWQVKSIKEKLFKDTEYVDYIIWGDAEYTILKLYNNIIESKDEHIYSVAKRGVPYIEEKCEKQPLLNFSLIDFSKFPDYHEYLPYVEESRNCPYSCEFCLNSCVNDRYHNVPFDIFVQNVEMVERVYGKNAQSNLLAANFGVNYKETKKKLDYLKTKNIKWNIELHVDNPWEYYIEDLKEAGICKASIGFESGSPRILKLMNKTKDPDRYLKRLEQMLIKLNEQGIKPSLNLLIDYRDDYESLCETLNFIDHNKQYIHKVKANFMFAFDGLLSKINDSDYINMIVDDYGRKIHAYPLLPSNTNLEEISYIIDEIEKGNYDHSILLSTSFASNSDAYKLTKDSH